jgi:hypothetical protein
MRRAPALLLILVAAALALPSPAGAADDARPGTITEEEAVDAADQDNEVFEEKLDHPGLGSSASMVEGHWEVAYFDEDKELVLVLVDAHSGEVTESWTGYQVAWKMARGYSGQFGRKLDAPYVFGPICALFLLGLFDWRRRRRVANLDLLVLLAFGISHVFFNRGEIGVSVPLQYPVLAYLLARALWIGFRGRGEGLAPVWPTAWLLVGALFLMGVRVGLNVADASVIDVGYAGVVGADRISHGEPIYDNFPDGVSQGDTYGPVNYYAYVPFERIWPWSGSWDDLPAAHGAAVTFDLIVFGALILLGLRIRPGPAGRRLAAILAFGWAAYPYTAFALESNSNDALLAALLVTTLLVAARPIAKGAFASLATWAKFAPALLAPMLLTYEPRPAGPVARRRYAMVAFVLAFAAVSIAAMLWPAIDPGLHTFYDRTIGFQAERDSPFSLWGQVPSLEPLRIAILVATAALSLLLAFRPRRKSLVQVAALSAGLLIALQITLHHWFYLYIVWFYPLLLVAMAALPSRAPRSPDPARGPSPARSNRPAPVS